VKYVLFIFLIAVILFGCVTVEEVEKMPEKVYNKPIEIAIFAGGCFWCMEAAFEGYDGVIEVISGYTGGEKKNPSYKEVSLGLTGHLEAVEVKYDPEKISYDKLLDIFWRQIDPTDAEGQFADRGSQYRTAIFYHNEEQKNLAEESKKKLDESEKFDKPVVTLILPASKFYPAEENHQDYYKKRALQYKLYKKGSGREGFIKENWE
jgi:peptide methionine sulfoxide reductase msrA/msrB